MTASLVRLPLLLILVLPAPAFAASGKLEGTASYRERIALTPGAVFEARNL